MKNAAATMTTSRSRIIVETRQNMSISNRGIRRIRPTHPGEMLREDFMPDYGLTVMRLAQGLGVSRQSVNEILRGRRAVSSEMAFRQMSPGIAGLPGDRRNLTGRFSCVISRSRGIP
jgi:addiction module HigA family antidote